MDKGYYNSQNITQKIFIFLILVSLLTVSCKDGAKDRQKSFKDETADITKPDSASELTMLKPKLDNSKIYGLGIFKIGTSIDSSITYLIKTKGYRLDSLSDFLKKSRFEATYLGDKKSNNIFKINHPKSTLETTYEIESANWCEDIKVYWIPNYMVDKINLENLYVTYYKNKLVKLSCDWSLELITAVESKYGKADENIIDTNQKPTYTSEQWYNEDIKAGTTTSALSDIIGHTFDIEIKGGSSFLIGCSVRDFDEQNKIDKSNKKAELKNF